MKKMIASMMAMLLVLALCMTTVSAEQLMGGWEIPAAEAGPLSEEAQAAFDKAMEKLVGAKYTPVALLATQIVAEPITASCARQRLSHRTRRRTGLWSISTRTCRETQRS